MQPQKARPRLESEIISGDAQSLPKFIRLQPKSVDQIRKRGLLLPPAWVIQEKAWERLTPILQQGDKFPALSCGITRSSDTKATPMLSIPARTTVSTSSTIRGRTQRR
jgi:hypothetical protein